MNLTFSVIGASLLALADLKEILVGPPVQARKEMRTWAGEDYDTKRFDLDTANAAVAAI